MKRPLLIICCLISFLKSDAQNGIITTIAGGAYGYSGDGGPATAAGFVCPSSVAVDSHGNIFIQDACSGSAQSLRKINTLGIISAIIDDTPSTTPNYTPLPARHAIVSTPSVGIALNSAENIFISDYYDYVDRIDTSNQISIFAGGFTGGSTGGPATAFFLDHPYGVAVDASDNVFIVVGGSIMKVDTAKLIHQFAGASYFGFSGDGGPATAALLSPYSVKCDRVGNVYVSENTRIRKIDTSGFIWTVAGNGIGGFSGDGGPATLASIFAYNIEVDYAGNIYFSDSSNRIRKVSPSGTISTIAGTGAPGFSGDGGLAKNAQFFYPRGLCLDQANNLYVCDVVNSRVRKISFLPDAQADSFSVIVSKTCSGADYQITVPHFHPGLRIKTYYGDGKCDSAIVSNLGTSGLAYFSHSYDAPGTYTMKHVLISGTIPLDSVSFLYNYTFCRTMALSFYYDYHGTCVYDHAADPYLSVPILVEIDSNSTPIDTVSCTSGLYFDAKGHVGDVYAFKIISIPPGMYVTCPSSGVIYDTIVGTACSKKYVGFNCATVPGFDICQNVDFVAGRHQAKANILISNSMCPDENATLTLNYSPRYVFQSASSTPSSSSTGTLQWNVSNLSSTNNAPAQLLCSFVIPTSIWLAPGDTINSLFLTAPTLSGDIDTSNNIDRRIDTVKTSFDPNELKVNPTGYITNGTTLEYTINFENTGNDTAFNIYILDTLSENLDPMSLKIVNASSTMNVLKYSADGHFIFKFEFPNVNLPDSSHHDQCDGMVVFNVTTKSGLLGGTTIFNHAGIFFDDNPVVMTDTVENIIGIPTLGTTVATPDRLFIYPNPAYDHLTISMNRQAYSSATLTNGMGQSLIDQSLNSLQTTIDINSLPAGVYFITLRGEGATKVQKFVKL